MLAPAVGHRRGRVDHRFRVVDVDDPRVSARAAAAGDEHLAHVVERVAAVAAVDGVALAEGLPGAGPVRVELSHRLVGTGVERPAVRRHVEPRIERQVQRRRAQRPQRSSRRAHLGDVRAALGDQHLAVAQRRDRRIPPLGRHVRAEAPGIRQVVEHMGLDDPVERRVLVPACQEQHPVAQVGETAAEHVEPGHVHLCLGAGLWIPDRGAREVVDGERLRGPVADGVVGQHLPVRQHGHVHPHDRPVDERAPAAHLVLVPHDRRRSDRRISGGCRAGALAEDRLFGDVVVRGVLSDMRRFAVDSAGMAERHRWGPRDDRDRQCQPDPAHAHGDFSLSCGRSANPTGPARTSGDATPGNAGCHVSDSDPVRMPSYSTPNGGRAPACWS